MLSRPSIACGSVAVGAASPKCPARRGRPGGRAGSRRTPAPSGRGSSPRPRPGPCLQRSDTSSVIAFSVLAAWFSPTQATSSHSPPQQHRADVRRGPDAHGRAGRVWIGQRAHRPAAEDRGPVTLGCHGRPRREPSSPPGRCRPSPRSAATLHAASSSRVAWSSDQRPRGSRFRCARRASSRLRARIDRAQRRGCGALTVGRCCRGVRTHR